MNDDGHYLPFDEVYGTNTTEKDIPSGLQNSKEKKVIPFNVTQQHVKNVNLVVECEECHICAVLALQSSS